MTVKLCSMCPLALLVIISSGLGFAESKSPDESALSLLQQARIRAELAIIEHEIIAQRKSLSQMKTQKAATEIINKKQDSLANLIMKAAKHHDSLNDWTSAQQYLEENLQLQIDRYGKDRWQVTNARQDLITLAIRKMLSPEQRQQLQSANQMQNNLPRLFQQGKFSEGVSLGEEICQVRGKLLGEKHQQYATSLNDLALMYAAKGNISKAEALLQRAVNIRKNVLGKSHPDYAASLQSLAKMYVLSENYSKAETFFLKAKSVWGETLGETHARYTSNMYDLGKLYQATGNYDKAEGQFQHINQVLRKMVGEKNQYFTENLTSLADLYQLMGNYKQAESLYQKVLEIQLELFGEKNSDYIRTLHNLSRLYIVSGEFPKAELMLWKVWKLQKETRGENHPENMSILRTMGAYYYSIGNYPTAEQLFRKALKICEDSGKSSQKDYAYTLSNLATLYYRIGEPAKAEPHWIKAINILETVLGEKHPDYATAQSNLAVLYTEAGEFSKAEVLHRRVGDIRKSTLGKNHPDYAATLNNLARNFRIKGNNAKAQPLLQEANRIFGESLGRTHPSYVVSLYNLADLYKIDGKYAKAEPLLKEVIKTSKDTLGETHPNYWNSLYSMATLYSLMGEHEKAYPLLRNALHNSLECIQLTQRGQSEATALRIQSQVDGLSPILSVTRHLEDVDLREIYNLVWQTRGVLGKSHIDRQIAFQGDPSSRVKYKKLQKVSEQLAQLVLARVSASKVRERNQRLNDLNKEKEELERELADLSEEFLRGTVQQKSLPADVMKLLPKTTAIIDLIEVDVFHQPETGNGLLEMTREYEAFILQKSTLEPGYQVKRIHLGPAEQINAATTRWLQMIERGQGAAVPPKHPAIFLRETIWNKLGPHLDDVSQIVIFPDSHLCFLPWAALPGERPSSFLVEDFTISTAWCGQELYRQLTEPRQDKVGLLVVGGVNYDMRSQSTAATTSTVEHASTRSVPIDPKNRPEWNYLKGTAREAEMILSLWPHVNSSQYYSGVEASEFELQTALPLANHIHLATHGFFADPKFRSAFQHDSKSERLFGIDDVDLLTAGQATITGRNPLILSGVVLAGANLPRNQDELGLPIGEDGILTAQEVVNLDLRGAELVTLSACDTGKGTQVGGGEGVYGLQRAFHRAGARHVVSSLWKVDDEATAALMKLFYSYLWKHKQHPATALRNAQLYLLYHPNEISTIAITESRALKLAKTVPLPDGGKINKTRPKLDRERTPVHLWAAFTHSGSPDLE